MAHVRRIPSHQDILRLSTLIQSYPASRSEIVRVARMWNLADDVIAFMRQFSADTTFSTRTDLVMKSKTLARTIRDGWEAPAQFSLRF